MGEWKRWLPPALAAAGMLLGIFLLDWAVVEVRAGATEHISPLGSEGCLGGACIDLPERRATWKLLRKLVLGFGLVGGLGCLVVAVLRYLGTDPAFFGKAASGLSAATAMFSIVGLIAIAPDSMGDYAAGGLVTIVAAAVGITARGLGGGDSVFGSSSTRAPLPQARATALPAEPPAPSKVARPNPVGAVAADALRGALRFIVVDGAITPAGLTVRFDRKVERTIAWSDLVEVAARRLPPDPPYDRTTFVDLVTAEGPLRLLPSSRLDYAALPGGMAPNTRENWRRLVALAREHNPAIAIEAESADFFAGGRDAPMFPAFKKFLEWDRRYS